MGLERVGNLPTMMDWTFLIDSFRFDAWANEKWLDWVLNHGHADPDRKIMEHILSAQEVWLRRCEGYSMEKMPTEELTHENLKQLNDGWLAVFEAESEDRVVEYRRTTGEPMSSLLSDIALHTVNHGTYHRGELRGLCRARGVINFPETDRIGFSLSKVG